ncbi:MAG: hypothetical protein NVS4B10_05080 [Myxococcales bacterium]
MTRPFFGVGLLAVALSTAGAVQAQSARSYGTGASYSRDTWPAEIVQRPLTLAEGLGQVDVPVAFNLSSGSAGKPIFVPLQLAYGVTEAFTLALTHQVGLCLSGTSNGCPKVYNDIGFQGLFALAPSGPLQAALVAGLIFPSLADPFAAAALVGLDTRYGSGPVALRVDPRITFGLNQRDAGNRETLSIPVTLQFQAAPNVALSVGSGIRGPINPRVGSFSDFYAVPLSFGAAYTTSPFDVGAAFTFTNLRGPSGLSGTDLRIGQVFASFRI